MTNLAFQEMGEMLSVVAKASANIRPSPVFFYPYLKRVLEEDRAETKLTFPCDIKIPKSNKYLLKQDFEPEYVIHLEKPVEMSDGTPMWLGTSEKQIYFRLGYENLDARRISKFKVDMEYIHTFLGGSSGHGKSVTINAILGALCYEYAPWELEVHLSDAKIIEFKKYGVGHRIPHISTIAATEDPDYVVSVLDKAKQEMTERAKIFANIGCSNLKNFREKTGLAYPRVMIIMDEVESTFKMAGRLAGRISDDIDAFARLGRAAGYHLFMATQNMSADIPASAVGQIRNRMCLGANQKTSEAVLGNTGATDNFGRIGRLITNTEVLNGGDTSPFNVKYQTPFLEDDKFEFEMQELEAKGQEVGYIKIMSFYDENDMKTIEKFDPVLDAACNRMKTDGEATATVAPIVLGYPAFVTDDVDALLKIYLDFRDVENIAICSSISENVYAHLHNITRSLEHSGFAVRVFSSDEDIKKYLSKRSVVVEARTAEKPPLATVGSLVRKRLFLMQLDQRSGGAKYNREAVEKMFAADKIPQESWGNDLLCRRATVYASIKSGADAKEWADVMYLFPTFLEVYNEFKKCNSLVRNISFSDFPKAVFVVGDLSKIVGYGRDTKSKYVTSLKKVMQDACRVGVLFVLYSRSMEGLNELISGLRYVVFDTPDSRDWGRMRTEEPATLSGNLALLYDNLNTDNPQRKFKKTLLREEF